jgi:hypothetical protein
MNRRWLVRTALTPKAPTPLGALVRGMVAGAVGAGMQSLFFRATRRWMPEPSQAPPELARPEPEARRAIHYGFGAAWGGLYGLARESVPISALGFGALVWVASDNLLLPALRLAAWPRHYTLREHIYALKADFAYGLSTAAAYAALRDIGPLPLGALPAMMALQMWAWLLRSPPARLLRRSQPWQQRILHGVLIQKAALA